MSDGFILRRWTVTVGEWGESPFLAPTRGSALADAWRCGAFNGLTFAEFLKIARARLNRMPPAPDFGAPITVCGKPAFYVDRNSAYVTFAYPGGKFTLTAHPSDVEPESFRPAAYRKAAA